MSKGNERGLHELYRNDPERADAVVFGRRTGFGRRGFMKGGLATMAAVLGGAIPFADRMPGGLLPAALAQTPAAPAAPPGPEYLTMDGKARLVVLQDRPLNAETPAHLLNDDVTPSANVFIRNHGKVPESVDTKAWKLTIDGEVNSTLTLSLDELQKRFPVVKRRLVLECAGNGRSSFVPEASGNQWTVGAVAQPEWTGVRLADVLKAAGIKSSAVYTAHFGADQHLSGDPTKLTVSRGVPMAKALDESTMLVWAINGQPLHMQNGFPLRLLVPGWPGSCSQKWLTKITLRDREHDGPGMTGLSYKVPKAPIVPGSKADPAQFRIMDYMPVRSIITSVAHGAQLPTGTRSLAVNGHAWSMDKGIKQVDVSIDYGATWTKADLTSAEGKFTWQNWKAGLKFPSDGYYEIWSRATDSTGLAQPFAAANWNPSGYGANPVHRVAVLIKA
ncbi:MAG TPA: sulfite oxidase [bacterium]